MIRTKDDGFRGKVKQRPVPGFFNPLKRGQKICLTYFEIGQTYFELCALYFFFAPVLVGRAGNQFPLPRRGKRRFLRPVSVSRPGRTTFSLVRCLFFFSHK